MRRGQVPPAPPPPPGRLVREGALPDDFGRGAWIPWKVEALVVVVFLLAVAWFWPGIAAKLRVHTSALDCQPPTEHEQLHIVVKLLPNGRLAIDDCMHVGSEGTYRRSARR